MMQEANLRRACWYRTRSRSNPKGLWVCSEAKPGKFYAFGTDFIEFEGGPGMYPIAIVEDEVTQSIHIVPAQDVCFGSAPLFSDGEK